MSATEDNIEDKNRHHCAQLYMTGGRTGWCRNVLVVTCHEKKSSTAQCVTEYYGL